MFNFSLQYPYVILQICDEIKKNDHLAAGVNKEDIKFSM